MEEHWQVGQGGFYKAQFVWAAVAVSEQTSDGYRTQRDSQRMSFFSVGALFYEMIQDKAAAFQVCNPWAMLDLIEMLFEGV